VQREDIRFSNVRSNIFTTEFYNLLPDVVSNANKSTILDLLEILATNKKLTPHLESLLTHAEPDVRLKALEILFSRKEDLSSLVIPLLSDSDRRIRLEAMHYLLSRNSPVAVTALDDLRNDPDPGIQAALAAAPLNDDNVAQHEIAFQALTEMLREYPSDGRAEIAEILGHIRQSPTSEKLLRLLLFDSSLDVQRAALKSIQKVTPAGLAIDLIDGLDRSSLTLEIRESLASYGESLIPQLQQMLSDRKKSRDQKKLVIKIARTIGGTQAREMLLPVAKSSDLTLRFSALKALNRLKKDSTEIPLRVAEDLLAQEIGSLNIEIEREQFISPISGGLMCRVLDQRKKWAQERIFRTLGLIYNLSAIENAYHAWRSSDPKQADKAAEWLDSTLRPEHRSEVLAFVDRRSKSVSRKMPKARKSILLGYIGGGDELPASALLTEFTEEEVRESMNEVRQVLATFPGLTLVEETLNWKWGAMRDGKSSKYLNTIQRLETLSHADIFGGLGPQELLILANQSKEVEFQPGDMIVKEGETANQIFVIVRGELERVRQGRTLEPMSPDESFGVLAALTQTKHFFSVRAVTECLCLQIERNSLQEILEDYPIVATGIFRVVTEKMQVILDRVEELEQKLEKI